jgi:hypothetical protein
MLHGVSKQIIIIIIYWETDRKTVVTHFKPSPFTMKAYVGGEVYLHLFLKGTRRGGCKRHVPAALSPLPTE